MRTPLLGAAGVLLAIALAGCGTTTATPAAPAPSTPAASEHEGHDHDHHDPAEATETVERSPRVVVSTETGVTVLDEKLAVIESFATTARPTLTTAHDDRHVIAVQNKAGVVNVIDSGSWAQGHGEHFHFFTAAPAMLDESLTGGKPVHVVGSPKAGVTAIYFDEAGAAQVLSDEALAHGELRGLVTVASSAGHHGVVAPLADGSWLVTQPGDDGALPDTIELRDASGAVQQTFTCNDMHGDVVVGKTAAFGCVDSVLIVRDGAASVVANPDASGERVGAIVADAKAETFVADWASDSLVFINGGTAAVVEVGADYSNIVVTPDGRFAVLGTDGVLRIYDASGAETQRFEVTGAWTKPQGHGGVAPSLAAGDLAGAKMIWVTEPDAGKVHAVDLFSNTVTSAEVAGKPGSIAVTNAS